MVRAEDITNYVAGVRDGNIPVEADNHTLILNWNDDTLPLLRQIAVSRRERDNFAGWVPLRPTSSPCWQLLVRCPYHAVSTSGLNCSCVCATAILMLVNHAPL